MKLENRVAIVTGTSPNIGGGIAEGLAAEGAAIVAVDANPANAKDCAAYINSNGGRAVGVRLFTRMPCPTSSIAADRVKFSRPHFDVE